MTRVLQLYDSGCDAATLASLDLDNRQHIDLWAFRMLFLPIRTNDLYELQKTPRGHTVLHLT